MSIVFKKPETFEERKARLERTGITIHPGNTVATYGMHYPNNDTTKYPEAITVTFFDGTETRYTAAGDGKQ